MNNFTINFYPFKNTSAKTLKVNVLEMINDLILFDQI